MQDEIRDKSVAIVIRMGKTGGRLTANILRYAIRKYLNSAKHGKQSVKSLVKQGDSVKNLEITDSNIKSFERIARKYGVDFALKKDTANGRYIVFFKAKDDDVLNAAFVEYTAKTVNKTDKKPSVREQLMEFKKIIERANINKVRNREKGDRER